MPAASEEKVTASAAIAKSLEGKPEGLKVSEIVEKVLATVGVQLRGKTPQATIAAILSTSNAKGGLFERTEVGRYRLRG